MEISLKKVVAIAIAGASAFGAMTASADVVNTDSGNGELTLFVRNDTTGAVYARGLQIRLDDILTESAIAGSAYTSGKANVRSYVLPTIGPDANLTAFLGTGGSYSWTIMGGDNTGLINVVGGKRYVTTTPTDLTNGTSVTLGNLSSTYNSLYTMLNQVNGYLPDTSGSSTMSNGQWRQDGASPGSQAFNWFGVGPNTVNAIGETNAANFYMLAAPGASGAARVYQFSDVFMRADGTLTAVPLPAAFWLLGTGLAGLAGVSRRRKSA